MARHISSLFVGLRSRSVSREPGSYAHSRTEAPRRTKDIQEQLDWQTLENHFTQSAHADTSFRAQSPSSGSSEVNGPGLTHSSTRQLEQELLARQFQEAIAGVGRRASELKKTVLQTGESEDDSQHEIHKSYGQLMKDSIELCSALAHKMERLRTKIHVASPRTVRRMQHPEVEASCAIPPTYSHEQPRAHATKLCWSHEYRTRGQARTHMFGEISALWQTAKPQQVKSLYPSSLRIQCSSYLGE